MTKSILIFSWLLAANVYASSVVVSWDANTEPDLLGYKIYYGTSPRDYFKVIDVGNVIEYQINNLSAGSYFFAVTAYNNLHNESDYSSEVNIMLVDNTLIAGLVSLNMVTYLTGSEGITYVKEGNFKLWGKEGIDYGFNFNNPGNEDINFEFDLLLIGRGDCLNRARALLVGNSDYLGYNGALKHYETKRTSVGKILFNFKDDCYDAATGSDANVEIRNLRVYLGDVLRVVASGTFIGVRE